MPALAQAENIGATFGNQVEYKRVRYDFAKDGGALGTYDIFTAVDKCKIVDFHTTVKTTATSGGGAFLAAGPTGDGDRFLDLAVGNFTAGATLLPPVVEGAPNVLPVPYVINAGQSVFLTIAVAALTAGSIEFTIGFIRA